MNNSRLRRLISLDTELSHALSENKYLHTVISDLENQLLVLNEQISYLRNELMKYQNFKQLREHYLRTIKLQEEKISKYEQLTIQCTNCYAVYSLLELKYCYDKALAVSEKNPVLICPNCSNFQFIFEVKNI